MLLTGVSYVENIQCRVVSTEDDVVAYILGAASCNIR